MAGRPIGVAIVGIGKVADAHALGFLALPECRIARALGMNRSRTEAFARRYEARPATALDEILVDPDVQVVAICTPHPSHAELSIKALSAGRHVLVEKPMALSTSDCDRMNAAAVQAGVHLGVVSQRRWYAPIRRMREALDDGKIGAPILSTLELLEWRGPEYYAMDAWRGTWKGEGGGVLVTQAIHYLDLLLWLAGPAKFVTGRYGTFNHPDIEVEDTAVAIVEFASGGLGSIIASNSQHPGLWARIRIHGRSGASIGAETERGSAFISGVTVGVVEPALTDVWTVPGEESSIDRWREEDVTEAARVDTMTYYHGLQIADFVHAIQEGRAPLVTGADGRAAVALFEAIYQSQATRGVVEVTNP